MNKPNTVKVVVDINEGIASATVEECPPGLHVDVEVRDYDIDGADPQFIREDTILDDTGTRYYPGGTEHDTTGQMVTALAAIVARIQGEFDHPALVEFGPLSTDTMADVLAIARHEYRLNIPELSVYQLSEALHRQTVAVCIMQPADVLTAMNLGQMETGDSDEQHGERQGMAAEWLAENRKYVEEAMTRDGFAAIEALTSPDEFSIDADAGPFGIWWSEMGSWKTNDDAVIYEFPSRDAANAFIVSELRDDVMAGCTLNVRPLASDEELGE